MTLFYGKYIRGLFTLMIIVFTLGVGCDDSYSSIDYAELEEEEEELRLEFFDSVRDSLMRNSVDSIIDMDDNGWAFYETKKGSSDSVSVGKTVAFKYKYYYLTRDDDGEPALFLQYSNYDYETLTTYTVGSIGDQYNEILQGVDLGIRYMSLYSKAYIIMSHSLAYSDYFTVVAEIEVVSMDLD